MREYAGIVNCNVNTAFENDFLCLNLWGKPVFFYAVETLLSCSIVRSVYVLSNSSVVRKMALERYGDSITVSERDITETGKKLALSGYAPLVRADTLERAAAAFSGGTLRSSVKEYTFTPGGGWNGCLSTVECYHPVDAFAFYDGDAGTQKYFEISPTEGLVIHSSNDFELALVLQKKAINAKILKQAIRDRIRQKEPILRQNGKGICLVGHSQLDNWDVKELLDYPVRNCAVSGISSFEYQSLILDNGLLECGEQTYLVMHGTNDIVYPYSMPDIVRSVQNTLDYILWRKGNARILFLACLHINGRMDRSNRKIDALNAALKHGLTGAEWIGTESFDDEFGSLKQTYTKDGLHLSPAGYEELRRVVERALSSP